MFDQIEKIYPICVIGQGAAGTMAALRCLLNNDECLVFPGTPKDKKKSRALWVKKVENVPAHLKYNRGIVEPNTETLHWMLQSPFHHHLHFKNNRGVVNLTKENDVFNITDSKGCHYKARYVILCTGVMDTQPHINNEIKDIFDYANAQTANYCLLCDGHHVLHKKTTVIGNTSGAAWVAIMLYERYETPSMTILTNGKDPEFNDEVLKLMKLYQINTITQPITKINGKDGILEGFTFEDQSHLESHMCFVSQGMIVYNKLAKQLGAEIDERGFVLTNENGESSIKGLYVAGDLRAQTRKQIYTSWDTAVSAANAINGQLRREKREKKLASI